MKLNLYSLRDECTELANYCHKNINRIIELMGKHPNNAKLLGEYTKLNIVLEKLCSYISSCCCNADHVSKYIINEYASQCKQMVKLCIQLKQYLNRDDSDYIRCDKMVKICSNKYIKNKSNKK